MRKRPRTFIGDESGGAYGIKRIENLSVRGAPERHARTNGLDRWRGRARRRNARLQHGPAKRIHKLWSIPLNLSTLCRLYLKRRTRALVLMLGPAGNVGWAVMRKRENCIGRFRAEMPSLFLLGTWPQSGPRETSGLMCRGIRCRQTHYLPPEQALSLFVPRYRHR